MPAALPILKLVSSNYDPADWVTNADGSIYFRIRRTAVWTYEWYDSAAAAEAAATAMSGYTWSGGTLVKTAAVAERMNDAGKYRVRKTQETIGPQVWLT